MKSVIYGENRQSGDRYSDSLFKAVFETVNDAIVILRDGVSVDCNPAALRMFSLGREEFLGSKPGLLSPGCQPDGASSAEKSDKLTRLAQDGSPQRFDWVCRRSDGMLIDCEVSLNQVEVSGEPHVLAVIRDTTEQKRLEARLCQLQRLEAVGKLAGGVAHDFNNILTAIVGYASLLVMKMKEDEPLRQYAGHIISVAESATEMTNRLLAFGRRQPMNLERVDLGELMVRAERPIKKILGEGISFHAEVQGGPYAIMADIRQMERVLMSLGANARDAMPEGGEMVVKAEPFALDERFIRIYGYGSPGDYICMSIIDSGVGMDESTASKAFEPFFTTKEGGRGTGLGLAFVYGVIKQHEGYINLLSEPGEGTCVRVFLPLVP